MAHKRCFWTCVPSELLYSGDRKSRSLSEIIGRSYLSYSAFRLQNSMTFQTIKE